MIIIDSIGTELLLNKRNCYYWHEYFISFKKKFIWTEYVKSLIIFFNNQHRQSSLFNTASLHWQQGSRNQRGLWSGQLCSPLDIKSSQSWIKNIINQTLMLFKLPPPSWARVRPCSSGWRSLDSLMPGARPQSPCDQVSPHWSHPPNHHSVSWRPESDQVDTHATEAGHKEGLVVGLGLRPKMTLFSTLWSVLVNPCVLCWVARSQTVATPPAPPLASLLSSISVKLVTPPPQKLPSSLLHSLTNN